MEQDLQVWTPDDADAAIARSEELEHEEHEDEHETVAVAVDEVVDVDMEIAIGNTREDDNNSVEITPKKNYKHCMQWWKARTLILDTNRSWNMSLEQKLLQNPT
ncbi:hypothetical protein BGX30_009403 [Mortierella sp. GBA39]|nr:hypothetical protein BGX30_009403 [Mortierella sp. GBA39]